jgi:hypothetical protein
MRAARPGNVTSNDSADNIAALTTSWQTIKTLPIPI